MVFLKGFSGTDEISGLQPQLHGIHNVFLKRKSGGLRRDFKSQTGFSKRTGRF